MSFIVHALPRSRTYWLSQFLSFKDWTCGHKTALTWRHPDDISAFFAQPNYGTVETGVMPGHWIVEQRVPKIKTVVIRRPVEEAVRSLIALDLPGWSYDEDKLRRNFTYRARMLDQISSRHDTLTVRYHELHSFAACRRIFEFCLPHQLDVIWWGILAEQNLQADIPSILQYAHEEREGIAAFKRACKSELRALAKAGKVK